MPMDDILADLLKSSGRTEQKVDDLTQRVDTLLHSHERRLKRLEKIAGRAMVLVAVISVPMTFLAKMFSGRRGGA